MDDIIIVYDSDDEKEEEEPSASDRLSDNYQKDDVYNSDSGGSSIDCISDEYESAEESDGSIDEEPDLKKRNNYTYFI